MKVEIVCHCTPNKLTSLCDKCSPSATAYLTELINKLNKCKEVLHAISKRPCDMHDCSACDALECLRSIGEVG